MFLKGKSQLSSVSTACKNGVLLVMATKKKYKKSDGKEAYRLWYEFLKRALTDKKVKVNKAFYKEWGDVENTHFRIFWERMGDKLLASPHVELTSKGAVKGKVAVSVPMSLTPTQAANELRELLIEHYEDIKHTPKLERSFALAEGKEMKVSTYRAYLRTYDIWQKLLANGNKEASGKELLREVRLFYLARTEKYGRTNRKVEGIPAALLNGMTVNPLTGKQANYSGEEKEAIRAIKRYLDIANKTIANVAVGKFPN